MSVLKQKKHFLICEIVSHPSETPQTASVNSSKAFLTVCQQLLPSLL